MINRILQLKDGSYKDFDCLAIAYELKHGKDKLYDKIRSASIMASLKGLSKKQERSIINAQWKGII